MDAISEMFAGVMLLCAWLVVLVASLFAAWGLVKLVGWWVGRQP